MIEMSGKCSQKSLSRESRIFTAVTILFTIPFLLPYFFPSLDGASHLSNSNIIGQLVFHHNDFFKEYFRLNTEPVPNWTGHLLITFFNLFLPAFLSEKLLLGIILIATPLAFRRLVLRIAHDLRRAVDPQRIFAPRHQKQQPDVGILQQVRQCIAATR